MHELEIAQEIVAIVNDHAAGARVTRVLIEVGKLAAVLPESLRFCFEVCVEGTSIEGERLDILESPGLARCRGCGAEVVLDQPAGLCACGGADLELLSGRQLQLKEIEVI